MNRRSPPPRRLSLLVLLLVSALIWLGSNPEFSQDSEPRVVRADNKPSSFVTNARIVSYQGVEESQLTIQSERAEFYDSQNEVLLEQPDIHFLQPEEDRTGNPNTGDRQGFRLTANKGHYAVDTGVIVLEGEVRLIEIIETDAPKTNEISTTPSGQISLSTEHLVYESKTNFIRSEEAVNITRGLTIIKAKGMEIDMTRKRLRLHSQVRGRHVFDS